MGYCRILLPTFLKENILIHIFEVMIGQHTGRAKSILTIK